MSDKPKLPTDAKARKDAPIARGVLDYFPNALAAVAELSRIGNEQHNPGQPMHWARGKSTDHADCILRHLIDRGTIDTDGVRHATKVAWRALALLQTELELAAINADEEPRPADEEPKPVSIHDPKWAPTPKLRDFDVISDTLACTCAATRSGAYHIRRVNLVKDVFICVVCKKPIR